MKINKSGFNAGGFAHPEIRPGDKWKDKRGCIITIESYQFNRVTFIREGYSEPCVFPAIRFEKEFTLVKRQTLTDWYRINNAAEKIQKLRSLISISRENKQ